MLFSGSGFFMLIMQHILPECMVREKEMVYTETSQKD